MKRQLNRQRLFVSQWYMGAGGVVSNFTFKPGKPFKKVKELYSLEKEKHKDFNKSKEFSEEYREQLKQNIKKQYKKHVQKQMIILALTLIISPIIIYFLYKILLGMWGMYSH